MNEDNFFEMVVPANQGKERLDRFLTQKIASVSRARVQKVIEEGHVLVNGKPAKASHLVSPAEKIQVCIPKPVEIDLLPEAIPLDIVYEDEDLLVVNKAAGMVVHPAVGNYTGTLVNALLHHCGGLSSISGEKRPGIVHRLDKDTSGLMVVAKKDVAHRDLSSQFKAKTTERDYWAIAWRPFQKRQGRIEAPIARSPQNRKKMAVVEGGKQAITNYEVIERFQFLSLIRLRLETGRTHQIRVHLAHNGHPLFGDATYGGRNRQLGHLSTPERNLAAELLELMPRQALHAKSLGFHHPAKNEFVRFDSDLPADLKQLLARLRKKN